MRLEHVALWTRDPERLRAFYERHFAARAGARYASATRPGFVSYFLTFPDGGARLEVMCLPALAPASAAPAVGYAHLALAVGARADVDALAARLAAQGVPILSAPRETGDGYYEAVLADPDGNPVEITARAPAPSTTATGDRSAGRLRPLEPADAPSLARHADDRGVWLNLRDRFPHPYRLQDAEAFIAHARAQERPTIHAIDVEGQAVGCITVVPGADVERLSAEIGYWIGRELWGRGIATEAVRAATRHAFAVLGMRRVFALPFARNAASHRVLEKAGFLAEGTLRHAAVKDGELLDQRLYAACADRWTGAPTGEATHRCAST